MRQTPTPTTRTHALTATIATLLILSTPTPSFAGDCADEREIASQAIGNAEAAAALASSCKVEAGELRTQRDEYRAKERAAVVNEAIATGRLFEVSEQRDALALALEAEELRSLELAERLDTQRAVSTWLGAGLAVATIALAGVLVSAQ